MRRKLAIVFKLWRGILNFGMKIDHEKPWGKIVAWQQSREQPLSR